ncbi:unnamed protein product [Prorocentrum cordatum]|uniref:Uncharacterized protein n=1 Tax=Prorocentrum cordatum TaxID=2364126 RepID=A0ABN9UIY4_9DINO|nr:unnamed protein product [Polarella glacialis]
MGSLGAHFLASAAAAPLPQQHAARAFLARTQAGRDQLREEARRRAVLRAGSDAEVLQCVLVFFVAAIFGLFTLASVMLCDQLSNVLADQTGIEGLQGAPGRACLERCRQLTVEQAARICWSFATVRLSDSLFRETQFDILEKMHQLPTSAICDLLWAYCVVRHRDPHFFKALLGLLTPSRVAGEPRCALLHPALLDIRSNLPDMDPEGLDRYLGYTHAEFRRSQLAAAPPEPALQSVAEALAAGGFRFETLADVDGYVADVVAHAPGEELGDGEDGTSHPPVAVLYHSSLRTLHSLTNEPLGQTMMRQRHLRWRGYGVVNLWSRAWDVLDAAGRVNFLKMRFKQAERQAAAPGGAGGQGRGRSE